jgi:hypothetical protein
MAGSVRVAGLAVQIHLRARLIAKPLETPIRIDAAGGLIETRDEYGRVELVPRMIRRVAPGGEAA